MISNSSDAVIVHSTIDLGRNLGLRVSPRGVETPHAAATGPAWLPRGAGLPHQPAHHPRRTDDLARAADRRADTTALC
jgi:hypothetical protein